MKSRLPIGIYEKALPASDSWQQKLDHARHCGFDFVEISVDESDNRLARLMWSPAERRAFQNAIATSGVPVITMCLSAHRRYALGSADPAVRTHALDIFKRAVELAAETGIRVVQLAGYYVFYEPHTEQSMQRYADGLEVGLEYAARAGIMLALENVDGEDVNSVSRAMTFVDRLHSPWLQVYPDIGNLAEHGLDVCAELERGRNHIVGIHVKDTRPGEPRRVPFGAGVVPFVTAFRKLAEMNYGGPVMLEMWNDDSPESLTLIERAREWVLDKMQQGGLHPGNADLAGPVT